MQIIITFILLYQNQKGIFVSSLEHNFSGYAE